MAVESYPDLLKSVVTDIVRGKAVNLMATRQAYPFCDWLETAADHVSISNHTHSWRLQSEVKPAENVPDYDTLSPAVIDTLAEAYQAIVRILRREWTISQIEMLANGNDRDRILDLAVTRENSADQGMFDRQETLGLGLTTVANSGLNQLGIANLITTTGANSTVGFNGSEASGWSSTNGVVRSTSSKYCNLNGTYTAIDRADGEWLEQFRFMQYKGDFTSPINLSGLAGGGKKRILTNYSGWAKVLKMAEQGGQVLGWDFKTAIPAFYGTPLTRTPELDNAATTLGITDPFYWIDGSSFKAVKLKGAYPLNKTHQAPTQPLVLSRVKYKVYNHVAYNPRILGVLYKA